MGLTLPSHLVSALNAVGFLWPEADEVKLFNMSIEWTRFSADLTAAVTDAQRGAERVWVDNHGLAITAFQQHWSDPGSPASNLSDGANAAYLIGVGYAAIAAIVLALKLSVIASLTAFVIAVAKAALAALVTWGAALALVPALVWATKRVLEYLVSLAIQKVLGA
jgi:hypothetical protein